VQPDTYSMSFDGAVLRRGFWLYVWRIVGKGRTVLYVGRTGDSSSPHAASPFLRIGAHLDFRAKAKGNALAKRLRSAGLVAEECTFEMTAVGPLFQEQPSMAQHKPIRDKVAALEARLADHLKERGYNVLGDHGIRQDCVPDLWKRVKRAADGKFPRAPNNSLERTREE
jgi:hypothetical protein